MNKPKGFLIDLDGVLYVEGQLISGADATLARLREQGFPFRFVTNTTVKPRRVLCEKLNGLGIQAAPNELFSTCVVAAEWLKSQNIQRINTLIPEAALEDFDEFEITDSQAQAVVVGDLGEDFNYRRLNHAFRLLKDGARLIALQKNRFWQTGSGLSLDAGPFVAALEYACETEAVVIGKPNRAYFHMAVADMGLKPDETAMIGDDIHSDIRGAQHAGLQTILVKTGKFRSADFEKVKEKPEVLLGSIAGLTGWLGI